MIHTRYTIFETLRGLFKRLFKLADLNPSAFKHVLYATILNDLKEWEEYIGESNPKVELLLHKYILEHKDFDIKRFLENLDIYRNVNTPLTNYTWRLIYPEYIGNSPITPNKYYLYLGTSEPTSISLFTLIYGDNIRFTVSPSATVLCVIATDLNKEMLSATNTSQSIVEDIKETKYGIHKSIITLDNTLYALFKMTSGLSLEGNTISIKF